MQDGLPGQRTFAQTLLPCDLASQQVPGVKMWVFQVPYSACYTWTALSGPRGWVVAGIYSFISA